MASFFGSDCLPAKTAAQFIYRGTPLLASDWLLRTVTESVIGGCLWLGSVVGRSACLSGISFLHDALACGVRECPAFIKIKQPMGREPRKCRSAFCVFIGSSACPFQFLFVVDCRCFGLCDCEVMAGRVMLQEG